MKFFFATKLILYGLKIHPLILWHSQEAKMTENMSRLGSMVESAKNLSFDVASAVTSKLGESPKASRPKEVSKLLNSRLERDNLSGMKYVILSISKGEDGSIYFADVVKSISSSNVVVKSLVLIYLTKYAEIEPDTALLSINSIQKSLNDRNAKVRAISIRSLAGISLPSIVPILQICIKKTISDKSPLVRESASIAIAKTYLIEGISRSQKRELLGSLSQLLLDTNVEVVGTSFKAFCTILTRLPFQEKWKPIHANFRRFCSIISDLDEWSQAYLIHTLTEYSRIFLPKPRLFYQEEPQSTFELPEKYSDLTREDYEITMDGDLELFINSLKLLIFNRSDFVVLAISKAIFALMPPKVFKELKLGKFLIRIASSSADIESIHFALKTILTISSADRSIFAPYYKYFYVLPTDSLDISLIKLQIICSLVDEYNVKYILAEIKYYVLTAENLIIARKAANLLCSCSDISDELSKKILKWCLFHIKKVRNPVVIDLLSVIRYFLQKCQDFNDANQKNEVIKINQKLASALLDDNVNLESGARATIIWIIGESTNRIDNLVGPDVLRILTKDFAFRPHSERYQILMLAAKCLCHEVNKIQSSQEISDADVTSFWEAHIIPKLFTHIYHLSQYDSSFDTRDRARMLIALLNPGVRHSELASLLLQVPKSIPQISRVIGDLNERPDHLYQRYYQVSDWSDPTTLPSASIRKEAQVRENVLGGARNAVSSKSTSPAPYSQLTGENIRKEEAQKDLLRRRAAESKFRLQSLDEFFASDGSNESDSEEETQSSSSQESEQSNEEEEEGKEEEEGEDQT